MEGQSPDLQFMPLGLSVYRSSP